MGLILDFVPNHVAPDHPWTTLNPQLFVSGTSEDLQDDPASFVEIAGRVIANGRDPYFPAWPDVVQLNAFAPALRAAVVETLIEIGEQCDGVRCDMAMLVMNDVFARTWGDRVGPAPDSDYWPTVISAVRDAHPGFVFLAEAYWDLEWSLQQQGFDYCYDKRLYDRILQGPAEQVRLHLLADDQYQRGLVRFVENHDEPRAASAFGSRRSQVAALTALSQTGARLVHNGQLEERRSTCRCSSADTRFSRLTQPFSLSIAHCCQPWPTRRSGTDIGNCAIDQAGLETIATKIWSRGAGRVTRGGSSWSISAMAQQPGLVRTPWADLRGRQWHLTDPTRNIALVRSGDDLVDGLFVELDAWNWHMFRIDPLTE